MCIRSTDAPYASTIGREDPWTSESLFTTKLLHEKDKKAEFFKVDAFHTVSLGVGKNFPAGALALLQNLFRGNNIKDRLASMTMDYLEYCKDTGQLMIANFVCFGRFSFYVNGCRPGKPQEHHLTNYINKIDQALLGWKSWADGSWNKAALTTSLCKFVEFICKTKNLEHSCDEKMRLIDPCTH